MCEFQNAYETSKAMFTGHILPRIPEGMFAVVVEHTAHCGYTDAVLPWPHRKIVKLYGSRRIAEHAAKKLAESFGDAEEVGVTVFQKVTYPPRIPMDDIPF
jgi:hypothetical protein